MTRKSHDPQERFRRSQQREESYKKTLPGEDDEPLPPPSETIHSDEKPGRNDPCPCGSGKKIQAVLRKNLIG